LRHSIRASLASVVAILLISSFAAYGALAGDYEDEGSQITHDGVNIHVCRNPTTGFLGILVGVDLEKNRFLCAEYPTPLFATFFVDTDTQGVFAWGGESHDVHVCPTDSVMVGYDQDKNWLVCTPTGGGRSDYGSTNGNFYSIAAGFGTVAINGPGGTQVPEPNDPTRMMHACNAAYGISMTLDTVMSGIDAGDNVLVCFTDALVIAPNL
jgi:hypothetical protein